MQVPPCSPWIGVSKHLRRHLALLEADTGLPAPAEWTAQTSRDHSRSFDTKPTQRHSWRHLCLEPGATRNTAEDRRSIRRRSYSPLEDTGWPRRDFCRMMLDTILPQQGAGHRV